jgi:hypothetical protein
MLCGPSDALWAASRRPSTLRLPLADDIIHHSSHKVQHCYYSTRSDGLSPAHVSLPTMLSAITIVLASLVLAQAASSSQQSLTQYANLFIGTASGANGGSGGNMFPGAAVPHAMVKVTKPQDAGLTSLTSPSIGRHRRRHHSPSSRIHIRQFLHHRSVASRCPFLVLHIIISPRHIPHAR